MNLLDSLNSRITRWSDPQSAKTALSPWLLLLSGTIFGLLALSRLLRLDYQFVGNDADLTQYWLPSCKFFRLWMHSNVFPLWNPFVGGGFPLEHPDEFYLAGVNLLQWILPSVEKSLDFILLGHALLLATSTAWLLRTYRLSPVASLVGGSAFALTGTPMAQLFSGHVALYCALCWSSVALLSLQASLKNRGIIGILLHSLVLAAVFSYGSLQGFHLVSLLSLGWLALQIVAGCSFPIQSFGLFKSSPTYPERAECGFHQPQVRWLDRLRDGGWALLKIIPAYLIAFLIASCYWEPQIARSSLTPVPELAKSAAPIWCWLSVFIPHFLLGAGDQYSWTYFPGWEGAPGVGGSLIPLLYAAIWVSRRRRDMLLPCLFAAAGALLATGPKSPFFKVYSQLDPSVLYFEVPSRMLLLSNFGLALLLAWSFQVLVDEREQLVERLQGKIWPVLLTLLTAWLLLYYGDGASPVWEWFFDSIRGVGREFRGGYYVLQWTRLSAEILLCLAIGYTLIRLPRNYVALVLSLLLMIDLLSYPNPLLNLRPHQDLNLPDFAESVLKDNKLQGAVLNLYDAQWYGQLMVLRYHEANHVSKGGNSLPDVLARLMDSKLPAPDKELGNKWDNPNPLYRALGVQTYLRTTKSREALQKSPLYSNFTAYALESEDFLAVADPLSRPKAYLSRSATKVSGLRDLSNQLLDPQRYMAGFNFVTPAVHTQIEQVLLGRGWQGRFEIDAAIPESLELVAEMPNEVHILCRLQAPGMVIVNAAYDDDWKVTVDGMEDLILPAQWGMNRGVWVGPGTHQIIFYYDGSKLDPPLQRSKKTLLSVILLLVGMAGYRIVAGLLKS